MSSRLCVWVFGAVVAMAGAMPALAQDHEPQFKAIFDGESLDGWAGNDALWSVEDGVIVGETTEDGQLDTNSFLIWEHGTAADFELRFMYRVTTDWANSGVQIRSDWLEDVGDGYVMAGYQPDIATDDWITGIHYEERGRGILARRGEATELNEAGEAHTERFADEEALYEAFDHSEWTEYHVIARGDTIETRINGEKMHEIVDRSDEARRSGYIGFQIHTGPAMRIEFKDVELKRLPLSNGERKVVMVAGHRSHGYMAHEHNAGIKLFARLLEENTDDIVVRRYHQDGYPQDPTAFDNADAVVFYANGGGGHPVMNHLEEFDEVMARGVGLANFHYAVEVPEGEGGDHFLKWVGGYFEPHWSVNPHWVMEDPEIATDHPVGRGVQPYTIDDEWYFHMRFREGMDMVTPIVSAHPPDSTMDRPDGAHSGNPHVREAMEAGEIQHVIWAAQNAYGGRGFGFTGGHWHYNWGHPMQRKVALNAIAWVAGAEVPSEGIVTPPLSLEELEANQDYDEPDNYDRGRLESLLEQWREYEDLE